MTDKSKCMLWMNRLGKVSSSCPVGYTHTLITPQQMHQPDWANKFTLTQAKAEYPYRHVT